MGIQYEHSEATNRIGRDFLFSGDDIWMLSHADG